MIEMKKIFRKVHLWISVPFGIFITLICFSGAMLSFEKEITGLLRPELYFSSKDGREALPVDSLMRLVAATLPDSVSATGITIPSDPERNCQVSLSKPRRASVYVDRYTGEVKGQEERLPFFDAMFHLHRWLLGEPQSRNGGMSAGKLIVGLSTLALVLILLSGILMWLTNRNKPLTASLKISLTKGWGRFFHDLHVAGGIYATIFLLAIALTGLNWSFGWYRTGFFSVFGAGSTEKTAAPASGHASDGSQGRGSGSERRGGGHRQASSSEEHTGSHADWQDVYETLMKEHPDCRQITISDGTAALVPAGRHSLRAADTYVFDRETGHILGCSLYGDKDKASRLPGAIYTVHTGSWGGLLTRILNCLAALIGATLPLTGYYLWIRRLFRARSKRGIPE